MPNKWFAAALGFLSPPLAFVYLGNLKWAASYFVALVLFSFSDLYLVLGAGYASFLLPSICCVHAYKESEKTVFEAKRKWYSNWWGVISILVVFVFSIFSVRSFFYEPFKIPSSSMLPNIKAGDHIVVSKWGYGLYGTLGFNLYSSGVGFRKKPERGEVFVLSPIHDDRTFIKRIIGLPNDIVEFENKQLYINGVKVETRKVDNSGIYREVLGGNTYSVQYIRETNILRDFKINVPGNSYFVMGDNRDNSADSRVWGGVPAENIVGRLVLVW